VSLEKLTEDLTLEMADWLSPASWIRLVL
jgi:hypothetical protein